MVRWMDREKWMDGWMDRLIDERKERWKDG